MLNKNYLRDSWEHKAWRHEVPQTGVVYAIETQLQRLDIILSVTDPKPFSSPISLANRSPWFVFLMTSVYVPSNKFALKWLGKVLLRILVNSGPVLVLVPIPLIGNFPYVLLYIGFYSKLHGQAEFISCALPRNDSHSHLLAQGCCYHCSARSQLLQHGPLLQLPEREFDHSARGKSCTLTICTCMYTAVVHPRALDMH